MGEFYVSFALKSLIRHAETVGEGHFCLQRLIKGTVPRKSMWVLKVLFSEKTTMLPFIWGETHANRAITARSWDYFVYLRDLALHKDHLPLH